MILLACLLRKKAYVLVNLESLRKGTAEILILHQLIEGDSYGYRIIKDLEKKSNGTYLLPVGTMYPILYRLIERGYVTDYDTWQGKRKRKYYRIEEKGKLYFKELWDEYKQLTEGIYSIVGGQEEADTD
jgi:PadR family transcriptional regulator PadR